jgi:hypothetical protein
MSGATSVLPRPASVERRVGGARPFGHAIDDVLDRLFERAPRVSLGPRDRMVVFSDLHMGDGGPRDDFRVNGELMEAVLRDHYLARGFALALNGDIEELQRASLHRIRARWAGLFDLFSAFGDGAGLYKIAGNHDEHLWADAASSRGLLEGVRLESGGGTLFIFHGHQATIFFERFNWVSGFFLRYVANTLRIANVPVKYESRKRFLTEHRVYDFSVGRGILSVIGHTHRPLFESLSKIDSLKFRIEQLCREYPLASRLARSAIETAIAACKAELVHLRERDRRTGVNGDGANDSLYNDTICVPCLFNSGCAIGKRGVTALEIVDERIALVHWYDEARGARQRLGAAGSHAARLQGTPYHRVVLKQDHLSYLFSRLKLLA